MRQKYCPWFLALQFSSRSIFDFGDLLKLHKFGLKPCSFFQFLKEIQFLITTNEFTLKNAMPSKWIHDLKYFRTVASLIATMSRDSFDKI